MTMPTQKAANNLKSKTLMSPISGDSQAIANHHDIAIAKGYLGPGIVINPFGSRVVAPCKAKVTAISASGNLITLSAGNGLVIDIIVGDRTVLNQGIGYQKQVKLGDIVDTGSTLLALDLPKLKNTGSPFTIALLINKGALKVTPYHGTLHSGQSNAIDLIIKQAEKTP